MNLIAVERKTRLIGAILVERGLITPTQLKQALDLQAERGGLLGEIVTAEFGVSQLQVSQVIAEQLAELESGTEAGAEPSPTLRPQLRQVTRSDDGEVKVRIGDVLQELGLVSRAQIDSALELQRQTGERLGEILVGQGAISRLELAGALSEHWSSLTKLRGPGEPGLPVEVKTPWAAEFKALASLIEDLNAKLDAMQSRGDGDVAAQVRRLSVKIDELALAPLDLAAQVERLSVRFEELVLAVPSDEIGALGEGHRRGEEILGRLVSELARLREENDARFGEIASAEAATARVSAEELAALAAAFEGVAAGHEERAVSRDRELTERVERLSDRMGELAAGALTGQLVARIDALADAQRRGEEALERLLTNGATASERVETTSSPTDLAADSSGALPAKKMKKHKKHKKL